MQTECAEWVWEQLQEEGVFLAGEIVDAVIEAERTIGVQSEPLPAVASAVARELERRGITSSPAPLDEAVVRTILEWEDEFLGLAGIPRSES